MATITTDFTNSVSRSRADRSTAGVVAGYIRELAAAPTRASVTARGAAASVRQPVSVSAAADTDGAGAYVSAARGRADVASRRGSVRGRGGCSSRATRMLESR
jgi:hypothetical protein